jgi:hypothetical protein
VQKLVAGSAAMSPEQLGDAARALDKQRVTLGPAPFHARALEHHGAVLTTFDGLSVSLQGVAALRGDGPKSPELQHAEPDLQKNLRALDAEVKALDTLCAK